MVRVAVRSVVAAGWLLLAVPVLAQPAPGCGGRSMLDELRTGLPEAYAELRRAADAAENGKHVLWKITDPEDEEKAPSYLYGTLQLTDDRLTRLSPAIRTAVRSTRRVAVEIDDLSPPRITEALQTLHDRGAVLLPARARLASLLSASEAQIAGKALARSGLSADMVARARPWVASVMLATPDCERSRIIGGKPTLDGALMQFAEQRGIGSVGMDTVELQLAAFAELPEADQLGLLKAHLALQPRINDITETMTQLYLQRDLGALWPLQVLLGQAAGVDAGIYENAKRVLITERNSRMLGRAHGHIVRGGVFVAVGAQHLPGPDGIVAQLKASGLTLTPVE
jgi:hypothetical protein